MIAAHNSAITSACAAGEGLIANVPAAVTDSEEISENVLYEALQKLTEGTFYEDYDEACTFLGVIRGAVEARNTFAVTVVNVADQRDTAVRKVEELQKLLAEFRGHMKQVQSPYAAEMIARADEELADHDADLLAQEDAFAEGEEAALLDAVEDREQGMPHA